MEDSRQVISQAGAIPFRTVGDGRIEVLLICRPSKKRWGIPKGTIEEGQSAAEAARQEAVEEAGAVGELSRRSVGQFTYEKPGRQFTVDVFLLRVIETLDQFPERARRRRAWFPLADAIDRVHREPLAELLRGLPRLIRRGPGGRVVVVPLCDRFA